MDVPMTSPVSPKLDHCDLEAKLITLLHTQAQLLRCAIDLAGQQVDCISCGDWESLRSVLGSKQRLAGHLAASATELRSLAAAVTANALSQTQRETYRQQQALVIGLYEQLFERERTAEQLLSERRTRIAQRAETAASWADRADAYAPVPPADLCGTRLDLSSSA